VVSEAVFGSGLALALALGMAGVVPVYQGIPFLVAAALGDHPQLAASLQASYPSLACSEIAAYPEAILYSSR
jgi:O-antigen/teichoic acid export membrane protein